MRILHVIRSLNPSEGGTVESIRQHGEGLRQCGATVEVVACGDRAVDPWISAFPLPVHALGASQLGRYSYTPRLRRWLREHGPSYDLWIINGLWQFHSIGTASVARQLNIPYYVYTHGMLDPWSKRAQPFKYLKKFIYWVLFEQRVLRYSQAVCFTATEEARLAATYFPLGSWNSFIAGAGILPPALPMQKSVEALMRRFPELRGKRIWTFLGRIHPKKGLDLLLKAFCKLKDKHTNIHLFVAGPGELSYVSSMRRLASSSGISASVTFAGPLYGEDKWAAFKVSELFVLPSHHDNFSMAVAEALAMGVPVCISDKVNIWLEISSSNAGVICTDDLPSLIGALKRWNQYTDDERLAFSRRAHACYEAHFRVEEMAKRVFERISEEISNSNSR